MFFIKLNFVLREECGGSLLIRNKQARNITISEHAYRKVLSEHIFISTFLNWIQQKQNEAVQPKLINNLHNLQSSDSHSIIGL